MNRQYNAPENIIEVMRRHFAAFEGQFSDYSQVEDFAVGVITLLGERYEFVADAPYCELDDAAREFLTK